MRKRVRSLTLLSGLRICCCCDLWCRSQMGLDPELLWLWCRPAAVAPIWPLAWEAPYVTGATLKWQKRKKKKKEKILLLWLIVEIDLKYYNTIAFSSFLTFQPSLNKLVLLVFRQWPWKIALEHKEMFDKQISNFHIFFLKKSFYWSIVDLQCC